MLLVGLKDILDTLYRFAIFRKPVKQTVKHWFFKLYPQVRLQDIKNHVENINDSYSDMGRFDDLPINKLERLVLAAKKYYGYRFSIDEMVSEIAPYTKEDPVTIRRCVVQLYRRRSDTSRRARLAVDIIEGARYLISTYKEKRAAKLEAKVIVVLERCDSLEDAIKELMFKFYPHCSEEEIRTAVNDRIQEKIAIKAAFERISSLPRQIRNEYDAMAKRLVEDLILDDLGDTSLNFMAAWLSAEIREEDREDIYMCKALILEAKKVAKVRSS